MTVCASPLTAISFDRSLGLGQTVCRKVKPEGRATSGVVSVTCSATLGSELPRPEEIASQARSRWPPGATRALFWASCPHLQPSAGPEAALRLQDHTDPKFPFISGSAKNPSLGRAAQRLFCAWWRTATPAQGFSVFLPACTTVGDATPKAACRTAGARRQLAPPQVVEQP